MYYGFFFIAVYFVGWPEDFLPKDAIDAPAPLESGA